MWVHRTSTMVPIGATKEMMLSVPAPSQNEAADPGGGLLLTCAGTETDIVVSEISRPIEKSTLFQRREQVAVDPCDAGGDHIKISWIFTEMAMGSKVVLATVHTIPTIPLKLS